MKGVHEFWSPRSAYLHIPFCYRRCFYCDFVVVPLGDRANGVQGPGSESIKAYLKLLEEEILISPEGPPLATIYIGGGTPSLLSPFQVGSLLGKLRNHFGFLEGAEITMEMDPASFDKEALDGFLEVGINRVSLGGQSFDNQTLEKLGRTHCRQDLLASCEWLYKSYSERKLRSWSLDLIQNLPDQDLISWKDQLSQAISTGTPHLSVYDLSVEPGTVFAWRKERGDLCLPSEDLSVEIMDLTNEMLPKAGLSRYEISNYAKPGHASRHNRVYWSGRGWWGFGQGSTSAPWGQRLLRPKTREGYKHWLENQKSSGLDPSLSIGKALPMPLDEKVLMGLRTREGVDLEALAKDWGWSKKQRLVHLPDLLIRWKTFLERGLIEFRGGRLRLSDPEGMALSNQVFVELLVWWNELPHDAVVLPNHLEHPHKVDALELEEG